MSHGHPTHGCRVASGECRFASCRKSACLEPSLGTIACLYCSLFCLIDSPGGECRTCAELQLMSLKFACVNHPCLGHLSEICRHLREICGNQPKRQNRVPSFCGWGSISVFAIYVFDRHERISENVEKCSLAASRFSTGHELFPEFLLS